MKQTSALPYSRAWRRDRTPVWRAGEGHAARASGPSNVKPSETHGTGRVCADDDCSTILSRYNPAEQCAVHDTTPFTWRAPKSAA